MASCGDTITIDAMLRSVLRKWEGCGVIAIEYTTATDPIEGRSITMEMFGDAANDGLLRTDEVTCTDCVPVDCDDLSLEELLREVIALSSEGHVIKCANTGEAILSCQELERGTTTDTLLRSTIVSDSGERRVRTISASGDIEPFDCSWKDKGWEELLRMCLVDIGDGAYAFRVFEIV